jgi:hypothetical protein
MADVTSLFKYKTTIVILSPLSEPSYEVTLLELWLIQLVCDKTHTVQNNASVRWQVLAEIKDK